MTINGYRIEQVDVSVCGKDDEFVVDEIRTGKCQFFKSWQGAWEYLVSIFARQIKKAMQEKTAQAAVISGRV